MTELDFTKSSMTQDKLDLALMRGDLRGLTKPEIAALVSRLTERMGVDPALAPIDIIPTREGRLIPYINSRGAAELRKRHRLEITAIDVVKERPGLVVLRAVIRDEDGRTDMGIGAASWREDRPVEEENAWMRAETKAKRRATMSIVGIFLEGPSDEVEDEATMVSVGDGPAGRAGAGAGTGSQPAAPAKQMPVTRTPVPGGAAGDRESSPAASPVCGDVSPYADGEACVRSLGHDGYHRGRDKSSWGGVLSVPEYDQKEE